MICLTFFLYPTLDFPPTTVVHQWCGARVSVVFLLFRLSRFPTVLQLRTEEKHRTMLIILDTTGFGQNPYSEYIQNAYR